MNQKTAPARPFLVTGASGFIGQRLVRALQEDDRDVYALLLPRERPPGTFTRRVRVVRGDVTDPQSLKGLPEVGTLFHLAAMVGDWGRSEDHDAVTVGGTRNILEAVAPYAAGVVLASSIVVYGEALRKDVCAEDHPFGRPLGAYSRCKQAQERLAVEFAGKHKLALTIIRPANVYGPGCRPWVHEALEQMRKRRPILVDGGDQNAGLCYVDNLVDLFLLAAASEKAVSQVYNACDGSPVTWRRYFGDLAALTGLDEPRSIPAWAARPAAGLCECLWRWLKLPSRPPITLEALNLVGSDHRVPIEKAERELGFVPRVDYRAGLAAIRDSL